MKQETKTERSSQTTSPETTILLANPISKKQRLTELLVDWILICLYLVTLFLVILIINYVIFGEALPVQDEQYSQLIATFTTTIPITGIFAWLDYRWAGSLGKQFAGLTVRFKHASFGRSLLRNILKFLPWQFGHMAIIHFMYGSVDVLGIISYILSVGLLIIYLGMGLFRPDKRHLGDLVAGSQVVQVGHLSEKEGE